MYEINILVNGSRCKQYNHDGKLFVEAKKGSEYTIEIKNNDWRRVLAVCSVDGLDILNGKPAVEGNPGYVINGCSTGKFDGFRVSNETVAKFIFDYKGSSYAASKEDGSERNVGVIGVRIFQEKEKPLPEIKEIHHHHDHWHNDWWWNRPYYGDPYYPPGTIWCSDLIGSRSDEVFDTLDYCDMESSDDSKGITTSWSANDVKGRSNDTKGITSKFTKLSGMKSSTGGASATLGSGPQFSSGNSPIRSMGMCSCNTTPEPDPRGFDMGTKWGEAKESRVIEVEFERGVLALTTNIYYASRQSLIEMGVPLGNEKQVSFPEPFADSKYAKPPKGWKS